MARPRRKTAMQRVVLAPSNQPLLKPLRVVHASRVLEEIIRRVSSAVERSVPR